MIQKAMVEPLNTKAWQAALDALGTVKANQLEPDLRIAVSAYISALPSLPVVDGGELVERLAYRVGNPSAWPEGFDQKASDLFRSAVALISSQKQEIERLTKEHAASQAVIEVQRQKLATNAGWEAASAAESRVLSLEEEVKRLRRESTDRAYMLEAYRSMLGPIALKVVKMWAEKHVKRVHHSWGTEAVNLTGEERAQLLLDWEAAMETAVEVRNIDSHLSEGGQP